MNVGFSGEKKEKSIFLKLMGKISISWIAGAHHIYYTIYTNVCFDWYVNAMLYLANKVKKKDRI